MASEKQSSSDTGFESCIPFQKREIIKNFDCAILVTTLTLSVASAQAAGTIQLLFMIGSGSPLARQARSSINNSNVFCLYFAEGIAHRSSPRV